MRIEILLTENELASQFVNAFSARSLPEKFFYWFPLSVKAWLDLCRDSEYRNFIRSYGLMEDFAREIVSKLPERVDVLSLGCGQGNKDMILLKEMLSCGRQVHYFPIDSSQALLEMACAEAVLARLPYLAWKADVTRQEHLSSIPRASTPRLHLMIGNTLGAFPAPDFCRLLRSLSHPGDFLLVDGEIQSPETITGYDNPLNRRFAFAPLTSIGISEQEGSLVFESKEDPDRPGLHYLTKHFEAKRNIRIHPAGSTIDILEGEKLEMNFSCKYTRGAFLDLITTEAGFHPLSEFLSRDEKFLMVLEGAVDVQVGERRSRLERYGTLYFKASTPHQLSNPEAVAAKVLSVTSPVGL